MPKPRPAKTHRTYHHLQLVAHDLKKAADQALSHTGLTTAQAAVLAVIAEGTTSADAPTNGISQKYVADKLKINQSAITAMLSKLETAELVTRQPDPADARIRLLNLTTAGRTALRSTKTPFETINMQIDSALSKEQVAQLTDMLKLVADQLQNTSEETRSA